MSKIDEKFINNLNNFSIALENIVELLKEQAKSNPTDVVNKLAENLDADHIQKITEDLEEIKDRTVYISDNTDKILKEVQAANKGKEAGMFEKVSDKSSTGKIVDGIKVVGLIAIGVLAIGTAFKIVGNVDFVSVMAISASIVLLAYAYEKIAKMGKLTPAVAASVALVVAAIGGGLLAAGLLLQFIPPLSLGQLITIGGLSIALGITMVAFSMAFDTVNWKKLLIASAAMPLLLTSLSVALVASSMVLQYFQPIPDPLELILGAGAIGLAVLAMVPTIFLLSKLSPPQVLMGIAGAVLMSGAIALSSHLIGMGDYSGNVPDLEWGLKVGLALLAFSVPVFAFGLLGPAGWAVLGFGAAAIAIVVGAILATDWLLAKGDYTKGPKKEWVIATGLAVATFGLLMGAAGAFLPFIVLGALGMYAIAKTMLKLDEIFSEGKFDSPPDILWSLETGAALTIFGTIMGTAGAFLPVIVLGALGMYGIAKTMILVRDILDDGDWKKAEYPSYDWALGVGTAVVMFASAFAKVTGGALSQLVSFMTGGVKFNDFITEAATAMIEARNTLSDGKWGAADYPSEQWAKGVGGSIAMFADAFSTISSIEDSSWLWEDKVDFTAFVKKASGAMVIASAILSDKFVDEAGDTHIANWGTGGYPDEQWAKGVGGSISMFAKAFKEISSTETNRWGEGKLDFGVFVKGAAHAMITASAVLSQGIKIGDKQYKPDWTSGYPTEDWAKGVGGALVMFSKAFAEISDAERGGFLQKDKDFAGFILKATTAMSIASVTLALGKWGAAYPSVEWSTGVSESIKSFAKSMDVDDDFRASTVMEVATAMTTTSILFTAGNWKNNYPSKEWIKGIGKAIEEFSNISADGSNIALISKYFRDLNTADVQWVNTILDAANVLASADLDDGLSRFVKVMEKIGNISAYNIQSITNSIVQLSRELKKINNVDNLLKMSGAFLTISVVDTEKLADVFDTMSDKANDLKDIFDDQTSQMASALVSAGGGSTQKTLISPVIQVPESENMFKLVEIATSIDENIQKIASNQESIEYDEPGSPGVVHAGGGGDGPG